MPELPEVETTCRGIKPYLEQTTIITAVIRHCHLRWPIPDNLKQLVEQQVIRYVWRRGKYLLLTLDSGSLLIHLGMSGSLRMVASNIAPLKHDHFDLILENNYVLRFNDPRRFGCLLWTTDPTQHELLKHLGPEPLTDAFNEDYLFKQSRGRKVAIKNFIMDNHIVVGVGNIYAAESLFRAGIHPQRAACRIAKKRYAKLTQAIKEVLTEAINIGGTTLRDYVNCDGNPGYFIQQLRVYGRAGEICKFCKTILKHTRLGQRATVYCPSCQR